MGHINICTFVTRKKTRYSRGRYNTKSNNYRPTLYSGISSKMNESEYAESM